MSSCGVNFWDLISLICRDANLEGLRDTFVSSWARLDFFAHFSLQNQSLWLGNPLSVLLNRSMHIEHVLRYNFAVSFLQVSEQKDYLLRRNSAIAYLFRDLRVAFYLCFRDNLQTSKAAYFLGFYGFRCVEYSRVYHKISVCLWLCYLAGLILIWSWCRVLKLIEPIFGTEWGKTKPCRFLNSLRFNCLSNMLQISI